MRTHFIQFAVAVLVIGGAGAAAGFFGAVILGIDGNAAPLNVVISGPIALFVGAAVGIVAAARNWRLSRYIAVVGIAAVSMVALGLALNWLG